MSSKLALLTILLAVLAVVSVSTPTSAESPTIPVLRQLAVISSTGPGSPDVSTMISTTGPEHKLILVYVMIWDTKGETVIRIDDDGPNLAYSRIISATNNNGVSVELWYAQSASNFASNKIRASLSLPTATVMAVLVYTGFDRILPFRPPNTAAETSSSPAVPATLNGRAVLVGGLAFQGSTTITPGTGYTIILGERTRAAQSGAFMTAAIEERTGTAVVDKGTHTVDFNLGASRPWALVAVGVSEKMPLIGGAYSPINILAMLAPYIAIAVAVLAGTIAALIGLKRFSYRR